MWVLGVLAVSFVSSARRLRNDRLDSMATTRFTQEPLDLCSRKAVEMRALFFWVKRGCERPLRNGDYVPIKRLGRRWGYWLKGVFENLFWALPNQRYATDRPFHLGRDLVDGLLQSTSGFIVCPVFRDV